MRAGDGSRASWDMKNTPPTGATLIELLVTLAAISALSLIAIPASVHLRNHASVRSATTELTEALALARSSALAESQVVAVTIDSGAGRALVTAIADTLLDLPLATRYGIALSSTRDSVAYGPTGRGFGAANATITLRRGFAEDTVTISRLGRVRH